MGKILDELRHEYSEEEAGRKWYQPRPKGDAMLYLGARMRDAEDEKRQLEKRVAATERAAIHIIGRFDADGSLYREFKKEIELEERSDGR